MENLKRKCNFINCKITKLAYIGGIYLSIIWILHRENPCAHGNTDWIAKLITNVQPELNLYLATPPRESGLFKKTNHMQTQRKPKETIVYNVNGCLFLYPHSI